MIVEYAILPTRVKAVIIDSLIIVAAMYLISEVLDSFENVAVLIKMFCFALILLYDPIFTSLYGGTIGHSFCNISVKKESDLSENISFPLAILRYLIKTSLGWISLISVTANDKRKAIHDFLAKSVVIES